MHLQEGIGRGGYRWLATVFVILGVLGLTTTLYAFKGATDQARGGLFDWLGFALTIVSLALLYGMTLLILARRSAATSNPAPPAATFTPMARMIDFEVKVEDEHENGPEVAIPFEAPEPKVVLPPNRNIGRDAKGWPARHGPSGMTRGQLKEMQGTPSPRAPRSISRDAGGKAAAALLEAEPSVPVVIARIGDAKDDPNWTPAGMARGKCGGCGSLLLAPPERPIRLRCPKCDKETMLR